MGERAAPRVNFKPRFLSVTKQLLSVEDKEQRWLKRCSRSGGGGYLVNCVRTKLLGNCGAAGGGQLGEGSLDDDGLLDKY